MRAGLVALTAICLTATGADAKDPVQSKKQSARAKAVSKPAAEDLTKPEAGREGRDRMRRWDYPIERKPVPQLRLDRIPLPPIPEGVEELKFNEMFKMPVGARGLELTDRVKGMDGKKVRVLGFQVKEEISNCATCATAPRAAGSRPRPAWVDHLVPGRMLLVAAPATINMGHYGLCDDLPANTIYVEVPEFFGEPVPFTPGVMLLTGKLSVGNKQEADGRISVVRLSVERHEVQTNSLTTTKPNTP